MLWHIPVSHYSEKARWALELKGVEHDRRAPPPGSHIPVALWLTRGRNATFPVLQFDGKAIGDSTEIIAALEERFPEPRLYPGDEADRARALVLEGFFDEEVGPHVRLLAFHELRRDRERFAEFSTEILPARLAGYGIARAVAAKVGAAYTQIRFRVAAEDAAERARSSILAALDRLELELDREPGDYLVGDAFSVADLTAAALLAPVVLPPQGPTLPDPPPGLEQFLEPLRERPGYQWVMEMFARHRGDPRRP